MVKQRRFTKEQLVKYIALVERLREEQGQKARQEKINKIFEHEKNNFWFGR